jgi:signal transduction histidine kinase
MLVDWTVVAAAVGAVLYLLLVGIVLLQRDLQERATRSLFLYVTVSFLGALALILNLLDWDPFLPEDLLARVPFYGVLVLSCLFLHLGRSFLRLEGRGLSWWVLGVVSMAFLIVLDANLLALPETLWEGGEWILQRERLVFGVLILGWALFMGGGVIITASVYHRTHQPLHRNRITYWPLVLGLTVAGDALLFSDLDTLGNGFRLLGTLIASYVVLTHRLPDVRQIGRRTASYLIITLLTVVIYTGGFMATEYIFQTMPGYSTLLAGSIMALVLAILFQPLLRLIQRLVNRLISGAGYDPGRALREYSLSISNILDLEHLATVAVGIISETMEIRRGALLLVHQEQEEIEGDGDGHFYLRGKKGMGAEDPSPGVLSVNSPVASCLRREHRPLTQYDVDLLPRFRETPPQERAWLDSLGMDVYVPIYAKGEWIGLLALGPKASGDRYFDDDLALLSTLADQTAVALENARLVDDLKVRNAENECLNEELTVANSELARLDQAKSDFINVASHELRTPLTQVRGYTEILSEMSRENALTPKTASQMTDGIIKASGRLGEIIDTMLDVSQLDTETLSLGLATTSLAVVVSSAVDSWAAALEERQQTLTVERLAELPTITADGKRLQQVFKHLIQNAIKYTPDGGQMRISGRLLGDGMLLRDRTIEIVVADNGIGISNDDLERIFDKFYRGGDVLLHSTGKTKFKGAGPGLGLTIARGIVQAHGGRIWAESPGYDEETCPGSEIHVVLPVQPRRIEAEEPEDLVASIKPGLDLA